MGPLAQVAIWGTDGRLPMHGQALGTSLEAPVASLVLGVYLVRAKRSGSGCQAVKGNFSTFPATRAVRLRLPVPEPRHPMFRSRPHPESRPVDRSQVIFVGGLVSAMLAMLLLLLAYAPQ